jgi:ATP-binding cassette subfamily C (CFTR/MRP) protein 10
LDKNATKLGALTAEEHREAGQIKLHVLCSYFRFVGVALIAALLLAMIAMQVSRNFSDGWLATWTSDNSSSSSSSNRSSTFIKLFLVIAAVNSALTFVRAFLFAYGGLRGARRLYNKLMDRVLYCGVAFFDASPLGRILCRFSTDVFAVDEQLPFMSNILLAQCFGLLGALVVISWSMPVFLAACVPLAYVYFLVQRFYRCSSRDLRRLDSVSRSPIYSSFSETLDGTTHVRAFGATRRFTTTHHALVDANQRVAFATAACSQWLSFRLQLIGVCVIGFVSVFAAVESSSSRSLNAAMVGLALAYALPLTDTLNGMIGSFTETEKELVSVERTCEYKDLAREDEAATASSPSPLSSDTLVEAKTSASSSAKRASSSAREPLLGGTAGAAVAASSSSSSQRGKRVEFRNYSMRYRETTPLALRDCSFVLEPGMRVAVIGRTGSGKSSLLESLFRMRHAALCTGSIRIDGVDIASLELSALRSSVRLHLFVVVAVAVAVACFACCMLLTS